MEPQAEFCPRCQLSQPTFEFLQRGVSVRRCQACGFPVGTGLTLEPNPSGSQGREIKILCVDDDPLALLRLTEILRFHGFTVLTAPGGEPGMEIAARQRPDLILLDIVMPGIDGFEVCRRLKSDAALAAIPVVMLTAVKHPQLTERAFEAGALLALEKSADTTGVLRTIEAALNLRAPRLAESGGAGEVAGAPPRPRGSEDELRVPVRRVGATFWTVDGSTFTGSLFIHLDAESHEGPETVLDRLNDEDCFLALALAEEGVAFLNTSQLIRVDVPHTEQGTNPPDEASPAIAERIRVQLANGEQLIGSVCFGGRPGRRRLSDYLNTPPRFLPLQGPERLHLIHKRFVLRVVPLQS
jgi:twitching motility two-component system response regulator PilH